jgi:Tfp pilus assembly protein PilO
MFKEEELYFNKMLDTMRDIVKLNPKSNVANILNKIPTENLTPQICVENAARIYNTPQIKAAVTESHAWIDFSHMALDKNVSTEKLIKRGKQLALDNKITNKEVKILEELIKKPTDRTFLFNPQEINLKDSYRQIYAKAQDVLLNPRLKSLANQMLKDTGLDKKGVSFLFATPEHLKIFAQKADAVFDNKLKSLTDKYKVKDGDNFLKKGYKKLFLK